jgi:hypothetical protein
METSWVISFSFIGLISVMSVIFSWISLRKITASKEAVEQELTEVLSELKAFKSSAMGIGKKVMNIERDLADTVEKQQDLEFSDPNSLPYNQASRLVQMGADVDDLMSSCGISKAEAELLMLVNRQPGAAAH